MLVISKKRGSYTKYPKEPGFKGNVVLKLEKDGWPACLMKWPVLNLDTTRGWRRAALRNCALRGIKLEECVSPYDLGLEERPRGPKFKFPMDSWRQAKKDIERMMDEGVLVHKALIRATLRATALELHPRMVVERGGGLRAGSSHYGDLMAKEMNLVRRRITSKRRTRHDPSFIAVRRFRLEHACRMKKLAIKYADFLDVNPVTDQKHWPDCMQGNADETGIMFQSEVRYVMQVKGAREVPGAHGDKRMMTALLGCSRDGTIMAPQQVWGGKTSRVFPVMDKPAGWLWSHTQSHWSTSESVQEWVEKVLKPFADNARAKTGLPPDAPFIFYFDNYAAHRTDEVKAALVASTIQVVWFPPNHTDALQPMDTGFNGPLKAELRTLYTEWFNSKVLTQLRERRDGSSPDFSMIDTTKATMRVLLVGWLKTALENMHRHNYPRYGFSRMTCNCSFFSEKISIALGLKPTETVVKTDLKGDQIIAFWEPVPRAWSVARGWKYYPSPPPLTREPVWKKHHTFSLRLRHA
jgi:hypothetical protein